MFDNHRGVCVTSGKTDCKYKLNLTFVSVSCNLRCNQDIIVADIVPNMNTLGQKLKDEFALDFKYWTLAFNAIYC